MLVAPPRSPLNIFKNQWVAKKFIDNELQCTLYFDDRIIPQGIQAEALAHFFRQIIEQELSQSASLIFKINAPSTQLFYLFMQEIMDHQSISGRLIDVLVRKNQALELDINFEIMPRFTSSGALHVSQDFLNQLHQARFNIPMIYQNWQSILNQAKEIRALKMNISTDFILSLQRCERFVDLPDLGEIQTQQDEARFGFSELLHDTSVETVRFFYRIPQVIEQIEGLCLCFEGLHFKSKMDYQTSLNHQPLSATLARHLMEALRSARNLSDFNVSHKPGACKDSGYDLCPNHFEPLLQSWWDRRPAGGSALKRLRLEMPVCSHNWNFYKNLVGKWSLEKLSLRLKNRQTAIKESISFNDKRIQKRFIAFGQALKANTSLKSLTLITAIPHQKGCIPITERFVQLMSRNTRLEKLRLSLDNTLGLNLLQWRQSVIAQFVGHHTLNDIILFGQGSEVLKPQSVRKRDHLTSLVPLMLRQIHLYNKQKQIILETAATLHHFCLFDKAVVISSIKDSNKNFLPANERARYEAATQSLPLYDSSILIEAGRIYLRNLQRSNPKAAKMLQNHILYLLLKNTPKMKEHHNMSLLEPLQNIAQYLSVESWGRIFMATGGIFRQTQKALVSTHKQESQVTGLQLTAPSCSLFFTKTQPSCVNSFNNPLAVAAPSKRNAF